MVPPQDNPSTYNLFSGVAAECEPRPLKRAAPTLPRNTLTASPPLGNIQELTLLHTCFGGDKMILHDKTPIFDRVKKKVGVTN